MPSNRMHRGLVALSASAVAAVYLAGYLRTQSADASIEAAAVAPTTTTPPIAAAATTPPPPSVATPAPAVNSGRGRQIPFTPPRSAAAPASAAPAATATPSLAPPPAARAGSGAATSVGSVAYKDGTFTGTGSSRRGDVWVSVDIQGGRITTVTITRSTLQYPVRDIAALPGEVVQRQSAQVDTVSRATYSSQAFRTAVAQALAAAAAA